MISHIPKTQGKLVRQVKGIVTMSHAIENINKEIRIFKRTSSKVSQARVELVDTGDPLALVS